MAMASAASLRLQVPSPLLLQPSRLRRHTVTAAFSSQPPPPTAAAAAASAAATTLRTLALPLLLKSVAHATRSALQCAAAALTSTSGGGGMMLGFASMSTVSTPLTVVASGMAKWLELYSAVMMIRVLLSWFPNIPWEKQPFMAIRDMCDPYLNLFRNIIPPVFNALDLSPLLAFMVLGTMSSILNSAAQTS